MSDEQDADITALQLAKTPEDWQLITGKLYARVVKLEDRVKENEKYIKPLRWLFNRVTAGLGTFVAAGAALWAAGTFN